MRKPTHPGEILSEDILPNIGLSQSKLAELLMMSRQNLNRILNCTSSITSDTAVKLGLLFGNDPQFWLNLQDKYDIWESEQRLQPELDSIRTVRDRVSNAWDYGSARQIEEDSGR
jgi:addiction module HigA family antidote